MEKEVKNKSQHLGFLSHNPKVERNLKTLALTEAEKSVTENLIGEKENGQMMKMVSSRRLILSYTIQQVIPNICTNFKILGAVVPEKSLTQISLCITLE